MIYSLRLFILALAVFTIGAVAAHAQPKGWPCDYGYRPGNTWFYRSLGPPYLTYAVTASRDSVGSNGEYWVYAGGYWYRIDSACHFDVYVGAVDLEFQHAFIASADSGDRWVMDSVGGEPSRRAIIYDTYDQYVFGKKSRISEVRYYFDNPDNWPGGDTWASGFGIIAIRRNPGGYDVLIGAIIDGKHYGTTSGLDESPADVGATSIAVYPVPTSSGATVRFTAHGERAASFTVHDMLGRVVQRTDLNELNDGLNTVPLDLNGLPPGAYMVTVEANGAACRAPLVIAR